jgi:transposase
MSVKTIFSQDRYVLLVGIDVAARAARVRTLTAEGEVMGDGLTIDQTPEGYQTLKAHLLALCNDPALIHITLEATGSLYVKLAHYLHAEGFAVRVVNALRIRRFAEVYLQLDKNDDLDALTLARFGAAIRPERWSPPGEVYEALFQLITQRVTLMHMHVQVVNRQKALTYRIRAEDSVASRLTELEQWLARHCRSIERRELSRVMKADQAWYATYERIKTIPGVGNLTAAWVIMLTHNFTKCSSAKELAAYVGLVPRIRQSGESLNTYRSVGHVGHDDFRQHLFSNTIVALHLNPVVRAYYDRIKARRGKHKIATIAAARKLLNLIWAVAKSDQPYDPDYKRHAIRQEGDDDDRAQ